MLLRKKWEQMISPHSIFLVFVSQKHGAVFTAVNDINLCCDGLSGGNGIFPVIFRLFRMMGNALSFTERGESKYLKAVAGFRQAVNTAPEKKLESGRYFRQDSAGNVTIAAEHFFTSM